MSSKTIKKNAPTMAATTAGASTAEVDELHSAANIAHDMAHSKIMYDIKAQSLPRLRDEVMLELMRIQESVLKLTRSYIEMLRRDDEDAVAVCQCYTEGLSQITSNAMQLAISVAERQGEIKAQAVSHVDTQGEFNVIPDDVLSSRCEESQLPEYSIEESQLPAVYINISNGDFHVGVM